MYRKMIYLLLTCIAIFIGMSRENAYATPESSSDHWTVTLGKPILNDSKMAKPIPGVANMYSLSLKNNGGKANKVKVQVFRDEPGSQAQLQLVQMSSVIEGGSWESGKEFILHQNLPVSVKANDIEVVVYWVNPEDDRIWKESLHLRQEQ